MIPAAAQGRPRPREDRPSLRTPMIHRAERIRRSAALREAMRGCPAAGDPPGVCCQAMRSDRLRRSGNARPPGISDRAPVDYTSTVYRHSIYRGTILCDTGYIFLREALP